MAKHFEVWLAKCMWHTLLALKNYMVHFSLELATTLTTMSSCCKTAQIFTYFSDSRPRGPTTLESGWPFGNIARKKANGQ